MYRMHQAMPLSRNSDPHAGGSNNAKGVPIQDTAFSVGPVKVTVCGRESKKSEKGRTKEVVTMGCILHAVLSNAAHPEYDVLTIPFPIPREEFDHCIIVILPCTERMTWSLPAIMNPSMLMRIMDWVMAGPPTSPIHWSSTGAPSLHISPVVRCSTSLLILMGAMASVATIRWPRRAAAMS